MASIIDPRGHSHLINMMDTPLERDISAGTGGFTVEEGLHHVFSWLLKQEQSLDDAEKEVLETLEKARAILKDSRSRFQIVKQLLENPPKGLEPIDALAMAKLRAQHASVLARDALHLLALPGKTLSDLGQLGMSGLVEDANLAGAIEGHIRNAEPPEDLIDDEKLDEDWEVMKASIRLGDKPKKKRKKKVKKKSPRKKRPAKVPLNAGDMSLGQPVQVSPPAVQSVRDMMKL